MDDPFNLQRFVDAQAPIYDQVCIELSRGRKASHWMWFIFPQIVGLGSSPMAQHYAIGSGAEATAYASHSLLGSRLRECTAMVNAISGSTAHEIFGSPDDLKFRSCLTLFAVCAQDAGIFQDALDRYYGGESDPLTLARL
ncbi:MAG TPA: DUF1810 domain-containing protein [Dehalococcoidia bacterium]|nr:DUF1810 domain-containing protein [Dehalococcoidia bacterium]